MAVKNINTTINENKTIMEIEQILVRFGARGIMKEYKGSSVFSLMFYIEREGQKIPFKLPMNIEKARRVITKAVEEKKLPKRYDSEPLRTDQARKVGWRIIKDWIHSQLSLLEINFAEPLEILLPYVYTQTGKTLYHHFLENQKQFLALPNKNLKTGEYENEKGDLD